MITNTQRLTDLAREFLLFASTVTVEAGRVHTAISQSLCPCENPENVSLRHMRGIRRIAKKVIEQFQDAVSWGSIGVGRGICGPLPVRTVSSMCRGAADTSTAVGSCYAPNSAVTEGFEPNVGPLAHAAALMKTRYQNWPTETDAEIRVFVLDFAIRRPGRTPQMRRVRGVFAQSRRAV
jgi:hypothetical protein